jgi:hypothetical protein
MSDDNLIEFVDRDTRILEARLEGRSVHSIAREFRCRASEVEATIARIVSPVTLERKLQELQLDLGRCDQLLKTFLPKALSGDQGAAVVTLRILEHRANLLGLNSPTRIDPVQISIEARPRPHTVDRITAVLQRVVDEQRKKLPPGDLEPSSQPDRR